MTESTADYNALPSDSAEEATAPIATTATITMVELIAPSAMAEGFTFDAIHDGVTFPVTVPEGGVEEGQRFTVPYNPPGSEPPPVEATEVSEDNVVPLIEEGRATTTGEMFWKDGIFDCMKFGCCHASCCWAWFFPTILTAQVMTRLRLDWCARPTTNPDRLRTAFSVVVGITAANFFLSMVLRPRLTIDFDGWGVLAVEEAAVIWSKFGLMQFMALCFCLYALVIMTRTRRAVREQNGIPVTQCGDLEDCCCVLFCTACSASQMARQTAQYDTYEAVCCSPTGLPDDVEIV